MDFKPKSFEKIKRLMEKGVQISNPATLDIGEDVNIGQISGQGVVIYPGCRIYGGKTVISAGCQLGYEAPATIEDCQLGEKVALKGGFFSKAVFLEKASLGMGAHVREGCILEEEAGGAHCVGLKQTILFPFVTLGSLINFSDCLMAGGTSRQNHSEVGSSYIHFNFTPDSDKTTPSLLGDVPRGVMLDQPPIFLGGQGGIVGPVRLGFGNVVAAGSILRRDYLEDNQLIIENGGKNGAKKYNPASYPNFGRIVENNILYLANLTALEAWYVFVRKPFLDARTLGNLVYAGALEQLAAARKERLKRLKAMAQKALLPLPKEKREEEAQQREALSGQTGYLEELFIANHQEGLVAADEACRDFLTPFQKIVGNNYFNYIKTIQSLPPELSLKGVAWLNTLVDISVKKATRDLPYLCFSKKS